jgi:hypothetical protein
MTTMPLNWQVDSFKHQPIWGPLVTHCLGKLFGQSRENNACDLHGEAFWGKWENNAYDLHGEAFWAKWKNNACDLHGEAFWAKWKNNACDLQRAFEQETKSFKLQ